MTVLRRVGRRCGAERGREPRPRDRSEEPGSNLPKRFTGRPERPSVARYSSARRYANVRPICNCFAACSTVMYIDVGSYDCFLFDFILGYLHNSCLQKREFVTSLQHQRTRASENGERFFGYLLRMTADTGSRCMRSGGHAPRSAAVPVPTIGFPHRWNHQYAIVSKDSDFRQLRSCWIRHRKRYGSRSAISRLRRSPRFSATTSACT